MTSAFITVNKRRVQLHDAAAHTTLLDFVRGEGLTGSKEGCAEGECGACAVLVARPGAHTATEWVALNACLLPALALDGQEIVTVEGLGTPDALHPVQHELAGNGGSQCGYCTPGFVCSMAAEYYRAGRGDSGFDLTALDGNLCRCTGYRPIRDAALALGAVPADDDMGLRRSRPSPAPAATHVRSDDREVVRPASLAHAVRILHDDPTVTVAAGCTDWGVAVGRGGARAARLMLIDRLAELREFTVGDDAIVIGAALSVTEIDRRLAGRLTLLRDVFALFGSRLIRNGATIGGNLGTASAVGDMSPALLAADATVVLVGADGEREVAMTDFHTGYRRTARRPDELITAVRVPLPAPTLAGFHKVTKRRQDDIAGVGFAIALDIDDGMVRSARIGLGGVAASPIRARRTESELVGRRWHDDTVARAAAALRTEGTPMDDHRATARYRAAMLPQLLHRFHARNRGESTPLARRGVTT